MFHFHTSIYNFFPSGLHTAPIYSPVATHPADARFAETVVLNLDISPAVKVG